MVVPSHIPRDSKRGGQEWGECQRSRRLVKEGEAGIQERLPVEGLRC